MPYPKNLGELRSMGYKFQNYGVCKYCDAELEWWKNPGGTNVPFNPMDKNTDKAEHHRQTCEERE